MSDPPTDPEVVDITGDGDTNDAAPATQDKGKGKAVETDVDANDKDKEMAVDELDEDEDGDEEEYEVRGILSHKMDPKGAITYLVAWKGYGPEHNTWESQDNLEHAGDMVKNYWLKQPKPEATAAIRKRARPSTTDSPKASQSKTAKKSASAQPTGRRAGRGANGNGHAKAAADEEDEEAPTFADTHVDSADKYESVENWEKLVETVDTIERSEEGKLLVYLTMKSGEKIVQFTEVCNLRCPQALLKFYEGHLKWSLT